MISRASVSLPRGPRHASEVRDVQIPPIGLAGILQIPKNAYALVAFAHGSGSSRLSPRNTHRRPRLERSGHRDAVVRSVDSCRGSRPRQRVQHSRCWRTGLSMPSIGSMAKRRSPSFRLGCSAPAPERRRHWLRRQNFLAVSAQWSRAAGAPTSPGMHSTRCGHRHF